MNIDCQSRLASNLPLTDNYTGHNDTLIAQAKNNATQLKHPSSQNAHNSASSNLSTTKTPVIKVANQHEPVSMSDTTAAASSQQRHSNESKSMNEFSSDIQMKPKVTLSLPKHAASKLLALVKRRDFSLLQLGIVSVQFDNNKVICLTGQPDSLLSKVTKNESLLPTLIRANTTPEEPKLTQPSQQVQVAKINLPRPESVTKLHVSVPTTVSVNALHDESSNANASDAKILNPKPTSTCSLNNTKEEQNETSNNEIENSVSKNDTASNNKLANATPQQQEECEMDVQHVNLVDFDTFDDILVKYESSLLLEPKRENKLIKSAAATAEMSTTAARVKIESSCTATINRNEGNNSEHRIKLEQDEDGVMTKHASCSSTNNGLGGFVVDDVVDDSDVDMATDNQDDKFKIQLSHLDEFPETISMDMYESDLLFQDYSLNL